MKRLTPLVFDTESEARAAAIRSDEDYYLYGARCQETNDCSTYVLSDAVTVFTIAVLEVDELESGRVH